MATSPPLSTALQPSYMHAPMEQGLDHIPGDDGWPIMGRTVALIRDLPGLCQDHIDRFGSVSRIGLNFHRAVLLLHPDELQQ